jgi:anti-sigma-K factor RskA
MTDDELREQLALYAADALTDDERTEMEDVLRRRPDLRTELDALQGAAAALADAVPAAPPPGLRASVLDAIAATPQLPAAPAQPAAPLAPPAEPPLAPVVPIGSRRRGWLAAGAAAAAVVLIVAGVLVAAPWRDDSGDDPVAAVIDADDAVEIPMPGSLPGLTIVHSPGEDAAVLLAEQVPVPDGDRVYELWAIRDGAPERFATFRPDDDGRLSVYAAGLDPASAERWAITEEPAGGSDVPTGDILNATA